MKRKEIEACLRTLENYKLDENKNWRPDIIEVMRLLEIERLRRANQSANYIDTFMNHSRDSIY